MKHKTVTGRTMALYCWCLLLSVLLTDALPITSKPLDNNPDHLTWEAAWLSDDNRASMPLGGKSKKITPKSIFITPFLNSYNASACPPDYKVDYNGKCIQVVSINTADILVTKLQSLFSQHGDGGSNGAGAGEDDYDYDYDSTGPFHVNLPLSIDLPPEPPQQQPVSQATPNLTYKDIPESSFYDSAMVEIATVDQDKAKITTVPVVDSDKPSSVKPFPTASTSSTPEPAKVDQSHAESTHTDISFLAFETLPNGTLVGQVELEGKNSTIVQNIIVSSTTTDISMADIGSTTESTVIELVSSTGTTTDSAADTAFTDGDTLASSLLPTQDVLTTTTLQGDGNSMEKKEDDAMITTDDTMITTTSTTEQNESDMERMNLELEEELLLLDSNRSSLAPLDPSTTDVSEMDPNTLPTIETLPSDEQTVVSKDPKPVTLRTTVPPPARPYVAKPTKPSMQIITPIKGSWDLGIKGGSAHLIAASHLIQQDRTTRATPETTTPAINVERSTQITTVKMVHQESQQDSEEVNRLQPLRELYEASNKVSYHNLSVSTMASTTDASVSTVQPETTTTNSFLQVRPLASTTSPASSNNNYLEQLRKINEIVAEKRRHQQQQEQHLGAGSSSTRIRFPSQDEQISGVSNNNHQQQTNGVRFPGTATNRLTAPAASSNRLPDIFPKKIPDSTTQRPAFWWLPSGWEVDQTGNKPMLLRFWSRMPLVRDSALQPTSASPAENINADSIDTAAATNNNRWRTATGYQQQQTTGTSQPVGAARGNSKSPSENFYKEVSAPEVYKVMNARQLNHHHQR